MFASLLVDGYKVYVEGKLERLPDNVVVLDAAIKLCQCEIVLRKNSGKPGVESASESSFLNSLKMFPSLANLSSSNAAANTAANTAATVTKAEEPTTVATITTATTTSTSATLTSTSVFAVPSVSASAAAALSLHSSSRPRGRPPGSKNSLSKSLDWNQPKMNPAAMAAMLGIYSNPAVQSQYSNPAQVSALLEEYYKLQAGISTNSLLSALDNVNVSTSIFTPPPPPKTFNSTATNKFAKYNAKGATPTSTAAASNPTSTVISVGSGQLTITPSSYASSKVSKHPKANPLLCDGADFDVESVIPKSELLTNKMFSEMSGTNKIKSSMKPPIGSNMTIPKDLPKSLTITPAPAGYSGGYTGKPIASNPHVTVHPEARKQKKSHKRSATVPYANLPNFGAKPQGLYGDVLTEYQQMILSQMNMMSRNMVPNPMYKPTQFQPTSSKPKTQTSGKKEQKSAKSMPFPMGPKSMLSDAQLPTMSKNSTRNFQPTTFRGNQPTIKNQQAARLGESSSMKFSTTPMTAHSPNKSPVLPPPIARQPSPAMHPARYILSLLFY